MKYDIPGLDDIYCVDRYICTPVARRVVQLSSRRRLLGLREGKFALTRAEIEKAEQAYKRQKQIDDNLTDCQRDAIKNIPLRAYFKYLPNRKPLLIVMLVHPKDVRPDGEKEKNYLTRFREELGSNKIVTFAIGFPGVYAQEQAKKYKVNKTYYQLHMIDEAEGEEDEE